MSFAASPRFRSSDRPNDVAILTPPNKNVSPLLLACLAVAKRRGVLAAVATIFCNPPVKTPAAPAEITSKNVLRLITGKICCRYQLSTP